MTSILVPCQFPGFLPCLLLFHIVLALLLATHQLHPHHLSKSLAYSLLITFPSLLQELPGASRWHLLLPCFPVQLSCAVFPQVVFGVPVFTPFRVLRSLTFSFSGACFSKFWFGLLFLTASALQASPGSSCGGKDSALLHEHHLLRGPFPGLASSWSFPFCFLTPQHKPSHDAFLFLHSGICHLVSSPLLVAFPFLCPHPILLSTSPFHQDCLSSPYSSPAFFTSCLFPPRMPPSIPL